MTDDNPVIIWTAFFAFGVIAFVTGLFVESSGWKTELVHRDLAQYCPTSGDWAWKGECE